jgi:phosphoribosylaminoimidazole-succinocarboxamide synthase
MGSVKDLEVIKPPTENESGVGRFHFSDRYSVFDWGEMPNKLNQKGASLCIMGAYCFEKLEELGIKTHYRGLVTRSGKLVKSYELTEPTNIMEIELVRVIQPEKVFVDGALMYDYTPYKKISSNYLIPLEIIYRNSLPQGSSIFRRLERGEISIEDLGLTHIPKEGETLEHPIFDISTKLEPKDRYISFEEAKEIAALRDDELQEIKEKLHAINHLITKIAGQASLRNEDGKVEFAFDSKRRLMVVDVVGTLDECRFTYNGVHVSKEVARQYYKRTEWYHHILQAKEEADKKGVSDWKSLCTVHPPPLDEELERIICEMYKATTNECTGLQLFDAPSLSSVIDRYKNYLNSVLKNE